MGLINESATAEVVAFTLDGALDAALFWAPTWGAVNKAPTVNTTTIFLMIVFFQNVGLVGWPRPTKQRFLAHVSLQFHRVLF